MFERPKRLAKSLAPWILRPSLRSALARSGFTFVVGTASAVALLLWLNRSYPISDWLGVPLGLIIGWQLLLNLAWVGFGLAVTRRVLPARLPQLERLVISAATGVAGFALSLYLLGALGLFRPAIAVALVLVFIAFGAPALKHWWGERAAHAEPAGGPTTPLHGWGLVATVVGVLGLGVLYLGLLSPETVNYDARWMHLTISQDYAREGRLVGFPGDFVKAVPHLASLIHTWDFLIPGFSDAPTRWMMALHTEFSLFLWTLVGVSATVNWLVGHPRVRGAWAVFFLFPGILVYDGNIGGAADHALAFFVLPLFLLSVRLPAQPSDVAFALWGALAGAALLTKMQAVYALTPLALLLLWFVLRAGDPARLTPRRLLRTGAVLVGAFVLVASVHFVRNWVFHGNPAYPLLSDWFPNSKPMYPDAALVWKLLITDIGGSPSAEPLGTRLLTSLRHAFAFPFRPHYSFVNNVPVFGFLFTLSLPLLLVVREGRRLWTGALVSLGALFLWAFLYRVDRNLQTFLPVLVATTAAILVRAWQLGRLARVGVTAIVFAQVAWGSDHWFSGSDRISNALALVHKSLDGTGASRFASISADYQNLERALPKNAVVLLHRWHHQLGIDRRLYLDYLGFQGLIDYRAFTTPRDLYERLRQLRVTHVVHVPGINPSFRQEEVIFHSFAAWYGGPKTRIGSFEMFPLPVAPPPRRAPLQVSTLGVGGNYADGLYDVTALGAYEAYRIPSQHFAAPRVQPDARGPSPLLDQSDAVLVGGGGAPDPATAERLERDFKIAVSYQGMTVYVRKSPAP